MKPSPAVASSNLQPLIESFLFLGSEEANLASLKEGYTKQNAAGVPGWRRTAQELAALQPGGTCSVAGILEAFTLAGIRTTTVNYGYWSRAQEHKRPIADEDRLHRFYRSGSNYDVYFVQTEGRGLVISLDPERLRHIVNQATGADFSSYAEIVEAAIFELRGDQPEGQIAFQDMIDPEKAERVPALSLVRLLHSLEHALLMQAEAQIGLQIFGAKILLRDATIVLYEQEEVGDGGIEQLVVGNGFLKLMRGVSSALAVCAQDCEAACPACNYIEDVKCRPFVPHEFQGATVRWLPANALLNRELAYRYLEVQETEKGA